MLRPDTHSQYMPLTHSSAQLIQGYVRMYIRTYCGHANAMQCMHGIITANEVHACMRPLQLHCIASIDRYDFVSADQITSDQTKSQGIYMIDCSLCMSVSILLIFSLQNACIYIFIYAMHASTMHQCMHPK